jgi:hypothetical protein
MSAVKALKSSGKEAALGRNRAGASESFFVEAGLYGRFFNRLSRTLGVLD